MTLRSTALLNRSSAMCRGVSLSRSGCKNKIVDFLVLFLRRAHRPDRPPLDSHPLPTDYETRALTNETPGSKPKEINQKKTEIINVGLAA